MIAEVSQFLKANAKKSVGFIPLVGVGTPGTPLPPYRYATVIGSQHIRLFMLPVAMDNKWQCMGENSVAVIFVFQRVHVRREIRCLRKKTEAISFYSDHRLTFLLHNRTQMVIW